MKTKTELAAQHETKALKAADRLIKAADRLYTAAQRFLDANADAIEELDSGEDGMAGVKAARAEYTLARTMGVYARARAKAVVP